MSWRACVISAASSDNLDTAQRARMAVRVSDGIAAPSLPQGTARRSQGSEASARDDEIADGLDPQLGIHSGNHSRGTWRATRGAIQNARLKWPLSGNGDWRLVSRRFGRA